MNLSAFLLAIAMVESGNNPAAVGRHGERTEFQISRAVWRQHSPDRPFGEPGAVAFATARIHTRWLVENMPLDVRYDPWWIAAAWNGGLSRCQKAHWTKSRLPASVRNYADRVVRLYNKNTSK